MAFYDPVMIQVNVLLVDSDADSLLQTCNLLQINSYKVTAVQEATSAAAMLVQARSKFDIVMIDVNSPDVDEAYKLLHLAVQMHSTVILMSDYVNPALAKCVIEDGAFMFLKKPLTMDVLMYLWQHVLREKTLLIKQNGNFSEENLENYLTSNYKDTIGYDAIQRSQGIRIEENLVSDPWNSARPATKSKVCTEWTVELHERFMKAVGILGEGRCFPKEIMELMKVPGLTRMQVASHLQKCRTGWKLPEERKPRRKGPKSSSSSGTVSSSKPKNKKYGLFPRQIRGMLPKEKKNQNQEHVHSPFQVLDHSGSSDNMGSSAPSSGMHNIQGAFDSTASDNSSTNNENSVKQVAENANVVVPDQGFQVFDMTPFDFAVDNGVDVRGINFNMQDMGWNQVESERVANMANGDAETFWSSWISSFSKDQ